MALAVLPKCSPAPSASTLPNHWSPMSDTPELPDLLAGGMPDLAGGGMPDLGGLLEAAEQMGQQMMASQAEAALVSHEGQSGGGMVNVTVNGSMEFTKVTIDPQVVDSNDVEMLEDLVLAAITDAVTQVDANAGGGMPDLGGLLGGMDLGSLLGGAE